MKQTFGSPTCLVSEINIFNPLFKPPVGTSNQVFSSYDSCLYLKDEFLHFCIVWSVILRESSLFCPVKDKFSWIWIVKQEYLHNTRQEFCLAHLIERLLSNNSTKADST